MADKKRLFQPQLKGKWLHGMEPLEPIPEGPHYKRWYKTRDKLPPNYLAKNRNRLLKCPMDTPPWLSVREGLDDFRPGCPPADNMIIRGPSEGFLSTTAHRVPQPPPRKTQNKLPKGAELLSKLSPAQQAQKAFVEESKASLKAKPHPLARYADLKEILPPDLLLMVLEELDPNRMLEDTWAYCEVMKDRNKSRIKLCEKRPKEVNPGPPKPRQPGTSRPSRPRTTRPSRPGTSRPSRPGTPRPSRPRTSRPSRPGTSRPSRPGTPRPSRPGTPRPSRPGTPRPSQQGPPSQVNQDLPAKSSWDLLIKSFQHHMHKPPRTSWASQPGTPGQVNGGPPDQVSQDQPPGQVILAQHGQVNQDLPAESTGTSQASQPEPPGQVNGGPLDQVNQGPRKESLLSCLNKLFPEEKKKKKSSKKGLPKPPDPYRNVRREVNGFCRWLDTFGDMGIDESFIMKQFEVDYTCVPTHNAGKIKKVTQIPVELYYSKELDDNKKREFALQESDWERKLRKPPDPYKPKQVKIRYGAWYLNPKTWKKLINDEPWIDPKVLKEHEYQHHGRDLEPDILDDLYGPIAFKDFIVSKGYRMPGVIEKLFLRKKWTYDSVKTPIDRVMKLISKVPDDTSDDIPEDD
ncbi:putative protein FAM47D [Glossophaga mutica]